MVITPYALSGNKSRSRQRPNSIFCLLELLRPHREIYPEIKRSGFSTVQHAS
jgi:hypothetical protein